MIRQGSQGVHRETISKAIRALTDYKSVKGAKTSINLRSGRAAKASIDLRLDKAIRASTYYMPDGAIKASTRCINLLLSVNKGLHILTIDHHNIQYRLK